MAQPKPQIKRRAPGKPALFEENPQPWIVGWLIPMKTVIEREPILVRVQETEHGWRGWEIDGDLTKHSTHYYRTLWTWATDEQVKEFDEKYERDTFQLRRDSQALSNAPTE